MPDETEGKLAGLVLEPVEPEPPVAEAEDEHRRAHRLRVAEILQAHTAVTLEDQLRNDQINCIPRSYQIELLNLAKDDNVLVCLDTGSGKTLISVLLLKHVHDLQRAAMRAAQNPLAVKRRVSFFLVNLVPLVHQQSSVIAGNSELLVGKLYGELKGTLRTKRGELETWRLLEWQALLESHDVIVSTAQVMLDALIHGFIKMSDINLLIFDEVHHAVKNHPFFRIMKYYNLVRAASGTRAHLPKIFGMTASPIFSASGEFAEASAYLQRTMDARIYTATGDSIKELEEVKQRPEELVVQYDPYRSDNVQHSELTLEMQELFAEHFPEYTEQVQPKIDDTLRQYGPLMCDLVWHSSLLDHKQKIKRWASGSNQQSLLDVAWLLGANGRDSRSLTGAAHMSSNTDLNKRILQHLKDQPPLPDVLHLTPDNSSSQILRFAELLQCFTHEAESFCGIVFVERRQTAYMLVELIKRVPGLEFIQPECIIGHDSSGNTTMGMDWHEQVQVLNRFRHRAPTNLLVATAIAEEGLDIQAANLVVRFDLFNRHISFLQSRGRARARDSRLILMVEHKNLDQQRVIFNAFRTEESRERWLGQMSEASGPDADLDEWRQKLQIEPEEERDILGTVSIWEPGTGARLFPEDAPAVVAHYVATLQGEMTKDAVMGYKLEMSNEADVLALGVAPRYACSLELPSNSILRLVEGGAWSSKKQAKRMAAFEACKQLRQLEELDEYLMPKLIVKTAEQRAAVKLQNPHHKSWAVSGQPVFIPGKIMQGWKRMVTYAPAAPTYYATFLPLNEFDDDCQPLMLLTRVPLPDTKLISLSDGTVFKPINAAVCGVLPSISADQEELIKKFTRQVFELVCHQAIPADFVWDVLVAPARPGGTVPGEIDFDELSTFGPARDIDLTRLDELPGRLVERVGGRKTNSTYKVHRVRPELRPKSISYGTTTYLHQHAKKFGARYTQDKTVYHACDYDQSLLEVAKLYGIRDLLIHSEQMETTEMKARVIVPQFFRVLPVSAKVANSALLLPSVLARYDHLLIAATCNRDIFDNRLEVDNIAMALMSPSVATAYSYERLEFLGDTFLKLSATCHVFSTELSHSEAELHLANKAVLSNSRLFREARRLKLWRYGHFSCTYIHSKRFLPPGKKLGAAPDASLTYAEGDCWERTAKGTFVDGATATAAARAIDKVGEKGLSDMVEALVGAGLSSGGPDLALFVAGVFGLIPATITTLSGFNDQFRGLKQQSIAEDWHSRVSLSSLHHIQALFEYEFQYPHLGLEAFTHPSLLASVLPSYQRLEFLGDAFIDYVVVMWIYRKYPHLGPGELTALKGLLVSNNTLSALGDVWGLTRFIASNSKVLMTSIQQYRENLVAAKAHAAERAGDVSADKVQYWIGLKAPKCVADVVESSVAAITVDAGFDIAVTQRIFESLFVPFYDQYCRPEHTVVADTPAVVNFLISRKCEHLELSTNLVDADGSTRAENTQDDLLSEFTVQFKLHTVTVAKLVMLPDSPEQLVAVRAIVRFLTPDGRAAGHSDVLEILDFDADEDKDIAGLDASKTRTPPSESDDDDDDDDEDDEEEEEMVSLDPVPRKPRYRPYRHQRDKSEPDVAPRAPGAEPALPSITMPLTDLEMVHAKALRKMVQYLSWRTPFQPPLPITAAPIPLTLAQKREASKAQFPAQAPVTPTSTLGNLMDLCTCSH